MFSARAAFMSGCLSTRVEGHLFHLNFSSGTGMFCDNARAWRNGRRARLRIWFRKDWRFKSSRAHHSLDVVENQRSVRRLWSHEIFPSRRLRQNCSNEHLAYVGILGSQVCDEVWKACSGTPGHFSELVELGSLFGLKLLRESQIGDDGYRIFRGKGCLRVNLANSVQDFIFI